MSDQAYKEATDLANFLWKKFYKESAPNWEPLDTTEGVITQIDNMVAGVISDLEVETSVREEMQNHIVSNRSKWRWLYWYGRMAVVFAAGCVFTINLERLIPVSPNYDAAWWKVILAVVLGIAFGTNVEIKWPRRRKRR